MLQQLRAREGLAALQADDVPLQRFHSQEGALLHLTARSDEAQPLRRIRRHRTASLVLYQQGVGRREPAILPLVDVKPLGTGDDEAHVGLPPFGKRRRAASGSGTCSGSPTRSQVRNSKIRLSKRQRCESSWHQPNQISLLTQAQRDACYVAVNANNIFESLVRTNVTPPTLGASTILSDMELEVDCWSKSESDCNVLLPRIRGA